MYLLTTGMRANENNNYFLAVGFFESVSVVGLCCVPVCDLKPQN